MSSAAPDYKALYENALVEAEKAQQQAAAHIQELTQKLTLSPDLRCTILSAGPFEIDRLRRKLFGQSSDNRTKFIDPNQIALFDLQMSEQERQASDEQTLQEYDQAKLDIEKADKPARKKREKNTRMELPVDLPRQEVVIHPAHNLTDYIKIGEDVTEVLEITPPSFYVKRITYTKWMKKTPASVESEPTTCFLSALAPSRTITGGIFGDSLLAYLVIGKFVDHLPLYRQMKIFERLGVHLAASTVSDAIASICRLLEPLYNSLKREVLANKYLQADETGIKVQDRQKPGTCHSGFFWAYHAPVAKLVLFDYQKGHSREGPAKILGTFQGVLQTDGYEVYNLLFKDNPNVTLAACMAHVRRKFDEANR